jgi:hypothetical protein
MKNDHSPEPPLEGGNLIRLKLSSLIILCVALILATSTGMLLLGLPILHAGKAGLPPDFGRPPLLKTSPPDTIPAWGELVTFDVEIEQPLEYLGFEPTGSRTSRWIFPEQSLTQVQALMQKCGLPPEQIARALSSELALVTASNTIVTPDDELILSLAPAVRTALYTELAQHLENHYMRAPYCFPGKTIADKLNKSEVAGDIAALIQKLAYERNGNLYFSDVELVVDRLATPAAQRNLFKALSRNSVVMARLRVRPDTDVDKLLGYWGAAPGVRMKDVRPLIESLKRLDEGSTLSLVYLLPPFARERLFTSPLPSYQGDPNMDCHWTAMNFFNPEPDYKFSDLGYTSRYIQTNYYNVAQASNYGDLIFLLDSHGNAIHSAVYIAADIVFTKNGNNYAQPWVLMRLNKLIAMYSITESPRLACYRRKDS